MCYVIITGRGLVWLLISIIAFMMQLTALTSAKWLVGLPVTDKSTNTTHIPSLGIQIRCIKLGNIPNHCAQFSLYGFSTEPTVYPHEFKAAYFFLAFGLSILAVTIIAGIFACCVHTMFKKSIVSMAGAVQAFAGAFAVLGIVLYPFGWGGPRVQSICGAGAQAFYPNDCTIGWSLYICAFGILLTFASSVISLCADKAHNSHKIQYMIDDGQRLICIA